MGAFQSGATVWSEDGRKAEYVSEVGRQHAIRFAYRRRDADEEEEYFGSRIETVDRVFASAPIEVIDAEIVKRQAKLDELTTSALEKSRELAALDKDQRGRMAYLQQHEELRQLEAWLSGKITHFVTAHSNSGRIRVLDWDAALAIKSDFGNHRTGTSALTLRVGWDKKLAWCKTERPAYEHLRPHTSLETAQDDARDLIVRAFAAWVKAKAWNNPLAVRNLIADATAVSVEIPKEAIDFVRMYDITEAERRVASVQTDLHLAMTKLSIAKGEV
jgi:hypothetical protein